MGRKTAEELISTQDKTRHFTYTYNEGRLCQSTDPLGRMHEYEYDTYGRIREERVEGQRKAYTYDSRGLPLTIEQTTTLPLSWSASWLYTPEEEHTKVQRSYDADGRLVYESICLASALIQETQQRWEARARHLQIDGHERSYLYQHNQLTKVCAGKAKLRYGYNRAGLVERQTSAYTHKVIEYNGASLPASIQIEVGSERIQESLEWNAAGKLCSYTYPSMQKQFTYTPRGFLHTAGEERYEFDFGQERTQVRTAAPHRTTSQDGVDGFGRVIREISETFALTTRYDSMGQVISQGQKQFTWDPWGRLLKVVGSTFTWEASYDGLGRRVQTRYTPTNGATITTNSLYDPQEEFQEIGVQCGEKTYWKLYGPTSCDAVMDEKGDVVSLLHNGLHELIGVVSKADVHYTPRLCSSYGPQQTQEETTAALFTYAQSLCWHTGFLHENIINYFRYSSAHISTKDKEYELADFEFIKRNP